MAYRTRSSRLGLARSVNQLGTLGSRNELLPVQRDGGLIFVMLESGWRSLRNTIWDAFHKRSLGANTLWDSELAQADPGVLPPRV